MERNKHITGAEEFALSDYEDFFENGALPLHLVGADGTILRANQAELDLLGYSVEEYIGRPISTFHADAETITEILRRLSAGEKLKRFPARLRAKDGSIKTRGDHLQR
nr:PAS domain-containing protein [Rhizobium sp. CG4]